MHLFCWKRWEILVIGQGSGVFLNQNKIKLYAPSEVFLCTLNSRSSMLAIGSSVAPSSLKQGNIKSHKISLTLCCLPTWLHLKSFSQNPHCVHGVLILSLFQRMGGTSHRRSFYSPIFTEAFTRSVDKNLLPFSLTVFNPLFHDGMICFQVNGDVFVIWVKHVAQFFKTTVFWSPTSCMSQIINYLGNCDFS